MKSKDGRLVLSPAGFSSSRVTKVKNVKNYDLKVTKLDRFRQVGDLISFDCTLE